MNHFASMHKPLVHRAYEPWFINNEPWFIASEALVHIYEPWVLVLVHDHYLQEPGWQRQRPAVRQIPIETQVVQVEQMPGCPVYFEEEIQTADACTSTGLAA